MIFKIPENYIISNGLEFKFTEHCFGNSWCLTWNEDKWTGDNMKGRSNGKVIKLLDRIEGKNSYNSHGCYIMCKCTDWNAKFINNRNGDGFMYNLWTKGIKDVHVSLKDGTLKPGSDYSLSVDWYPATGQTYDGYDLLLINCLISNYSTNTFQTDNVDNILVDICTDAYVYKSKTH